MSAGLTSGIHYRDGRVGKAGLRGSGAPECTWRGYRLTIMDCLMPEMDGWQTTICIKNLFMMEKIRVLPYIIAYSAFDSREDANKSMDAGMCDHISKPCTQKTLCQAVSRWVKLPLNTQPI